MGRTKLYTTEEEKINAQRRYCRESYHRHKAENANKYRLRAKKRYYEQKLQRNPDDEDTKAKLAQITEELRTATTKQPENSSEQAETKE